jgi:hypothetical protein
VSIIDDDGNNSLFVLIVGRTRLNDDSKDNDRYINIMIVVFANHVVVRFQIYHYHFG